MIYRQKKSRLMRMAIHRKHPVIASTKCVAIHVLIILLLFLSTSCTKKQEEVIVFDSSEPLSLAPDVEWALVTDPYAAYKTSTDWNAEISGHCRRGEILRVYAKSMDKEKTVWYKFEEGWLPEKCLKIYTNRYKAQTAAGALK